MRHVMTSAVLMAGRLIGGLPAQASTTPPTNNDVTTLAQAGIGEDAIAAAIQAQDASFDISVPALLKLKQDGITPKVLHAMVAAMSKQRERVQKDGGHGVRLALASGLATYGWTIPTWRWEKTIFT